MCFRGGGWKTKSSESSRTFSREVLNVAIGERTSEE